MTPFRHILVATDFSEPAKRALDIAGSLANKLEAKLTVFHVFVFPQINYGFSGYQPESQYRLSAQKALEDLVAAEKKRLPSIKGVMVEGQPALEILYAIDQRKVGLVAMGTHGHNWIARTLLGSVADKVVRTALIPVLSIPALNPKKRRRPEGDALVGRERWGL